MSSRIEFTDAMVDQPTVEHEIADLESSIVPTTGKLDNLSEAPAYRGVVDIFTAEGRVDGWCLSTSDPTTPVSIEIYIGPFKFAEFMTGKKRADIAEAVGLPVVPGFSNEIEQQNHADTEGILHFLCEPKSLAAPFTELVLFRIKNSRVALPMSPRIKLSRDDLFNLVSKPQIIKGSLDALDSKGGFRGAVDRQSQGVISGWCVNTGNPDFPVELEIYLKDALLGVTTNSEPRKDVSELLKGPVKSGFVFKPEDMTATTLAGAMKVLSEAIEAPGKAAQMLSIKVRGTNCHLPVLPTVTFTAADLKRYYDEATAKLGSVASNQRIGLVEELMSPTKSRAVTTPDDVKLVAFYLPQFHPFSENNEWWGEGFTEWTNVTTARAYFEGHDQPRIPSDLGYYDLRLDQIQEKQIDLARRYGVSAFCYYYYSFSGTKLMTFPIDRHVEKNYDMDFCLCWANENWSRRWDGSESDVLMSQTHTELDDLAFIDNVIPYFSSEKYIKFDGAPLLLVYRISLLAKPAQTIENWKRKVRAAGFPDLHVCMAESFGLTDPNEFGADSTCQFPPHGVSAREINTTVANIDKGFEGKIYDYIEVAANEVRRPDPAHTRFRCAMPSWDNTSRKGKAGNVFHNASPEVFEAWLSVLCAKAKRDLPSGKRLVFVNAWNEWGEGAYLEPDRLNGHRNLKAVRAALTTSNMLLSESLIAQAEGATEPEDQNAMQLVATLASVNRRLLQFATDYSSLPTGGPSPFVPIPKGSIRLQKVENSFCNVDSLNGRRVTNHEVTIVRGQKLGVSGWVRVPGVNLIESLPVFVRLSGSGDHAFIASIYDRETRQDVQAYYSDPNDHVHGFRCSLDFFSVAPGIYHVEILVGSLGDTNAVYVVPTKIMLIIA